MNNRLFNQPTATTLEIFSYNENDDLIALSMLNHYGRSFFASNHVNKLSASQHNGLNEEFQFLITSQRVEQIEYASIIAKSKNFPTLNLFEKNKFLDVWNTYLGTEQIKASSNLITGLTRITPAFKIALKSSYVDKTKLVMINCKLETLPKDLFEGLSNLTTIFIRNNHLQRLPNKIFADCSKLKMLSIAKNCLSIPDSHPYFNLSRNVLIFDGDQEISLTKNELNTENYEGRLEFLLNHQIHNIDYTKLKACTNNFEELKATEKAAILTEWEITIGLAQLTDELVNKGSVNLFGLTSLPNPILDRLKAVNAETPITEFYLTGNGFKQLPVKLFENFNQLQTLHLDTLDTNSDAKLFKDCTGLSLVMLSYSRYADLSLEKQHYELKNNVKLLSTKIVATNDNEEKSVTNSIYKMG